MSRETARYTYVKGSRPEGVAIYDSDTKIHSHHDTDPARGQHNAFDLVRLHRFGHLDKDCGGRLMRDRPSYQAMVEFAQSLPEIRKARSVGELQEPAPEPAANDDWLGISQPAQDSPNCVVSADKFAGTLAPREWVIKGLVLSGAELVFVYGQPGDGKSFFAVDALTDVHLGRPACGGRKTKQQRVIRLVAEGASDDRFRCHAIAAAKGVPLSALPAVIASAPDLSTDVCALDVAKQIQAAGGCDILLIDTLAATNTLDENSSEMSQYIRHIKQIGRSVGCSVWVIAHAGKDLAKGMRGWSGAKAAADVEIEITRGDDCRIVTLTKSKGSVDGTSLAFKLKPVVLGRDADGDDYGSCTVEYVTDVRRVAKRLPKLNTESRRVYDLMMSEISKGFGEAVEDEVIAAIAATKREPAPGEVDKRKSRATQEVDRLVSQGFAIRDGRMLKTSLVIKGNDADF